MPSNQTGRIVTCAQLLIAIVIVSVAMLFGPGRAYAAGRPNILLLVSDDQRPDTIHALGNPLIRTPHLDSLVERGCSMLRATCGNPICTPSRAEILTGCTSFRNGVLDFGRQIDPDLPTMAGWFSKAGYRTCYVGKWHNDGVPTERGYDRTNGLYRGGGGSFYKPQTDWAGRPVTGYRGWIFQNDAGTLLPEHGVGLTPDISARFADAACELINDKSDEPFFLHVNFTAPHDPLLLPPGEEFRYEAAEMPLPANFLPRHPFDHGNFDGRDEQLFAWPRTPEETRGELAAYYAVISHMDAQIGRILATLKDSDQLDNTLIVFTSDHGLSIGSHGLRGKQNMYEHTINVPLLISGPAVPRGVRRQGQCCLRDLFPTLCELAGIDGPGDRIDGRSLMPVIKGQQDEVHPFITGYFRNVQRMIRREHWKYIEYPAVGETQLFDLNSDPFEQTNLARSVDHQAIKSELVELLRTWQREQHDPAEPRP